MLSKINCACLFGIDAMIINVEVDIINKGLPSISVVGLCDTSVKESKERVNATIKNNSYKMPEGKITINLAPASIKKDGTQYDLAIAIGILIASYQIMPRVNLDDYLFIGELSLDGTLRKVNGILPIVTECKKRGIKNIVVPYDNKKEASIIENINVYPARNLKEVISHITGAKQLNKYKTDISKLFNDDVIYNVDFSEVKGQENVKRALEIAAAGSHNVLMSGPPGSGKTMLAKRFPTILPKMTLEECLEVTKIYSVSGLIDNDTPLITKRPVRSPHHTISNVSLIGGGRIPRAGEVSLSHRGVLFLDEFPEFQKNALEVLRQPLEDGKVNISRVEATLSYPANFMLLASMNPCPCGYYGDSKIECTCTKAQIDKYQNKISGPLLDRIDITINVPRQEYDKLRIDDNNKARSSKEIRESVNKARKIQLDRYKGTNILFNSMLTPSLIEKYCKLDSKSENILKLAFDKLNLSARGYHRILKLARTIADLEGSENIKTEHLTEALQYRSMN